MQSRAPGVSSFVWDKVVDYDGLHYPIDCAKDYDICYVAFFRERKNHRLLFESMSRVPGRRVRCVCVGEDVKGYEREMQLLVAGLGIDVEFRGLVPKADVNGIVNRSRIGVIASEKDAAPRALLEYLAADVPVLVNALLRAGTRYVGPRAGIVRRPQEWPDAIAELLDSTDRYEPRAHLLEQYSRDHVIDRFVAILEQAGALEGARV
jgi:glycosyltransferase involved in cell wall biosynthesis